MKKWIKIILLLVSVICLSGCKSTAIRWQEQYDLGAKYLSEGNYQEAILTFTAAIEIDPKQIPAYVGRGNAYVRFSETEEARHLTFDEMGDLTYTDEEIAEMEAAKVAENLDAAQADYEKAIELDETSIDAYLGWADVYIRLGDYDKALEILQQGLEKTDSDRLVEKIKEFEDGTITDSSGEIRAVINDNAADGQPKYLEAIHVRPDENLRSVFTDLSFYDKSNVAIILDGADYEIDDYVLDLKNVTIQGTQGTRLVSYSGYDTVVNFQRCKGLTLKNLVIGHELPSTKKSCQAGVLWITESEVSLVNCDIFGCGKYGISVSDSTLVAQDSVIRDCSSWIMSLVDSNVTFHKCAFSGNGYEAPADEAVFVNAYDREDDVLVIKFSDCTFTNNKNQNLYSLPSHNQYNLGRIQIEFNNCSFFGNAWE